MIGWLRVVLALTIFAIGTGAGALLHLIARRTGWIGEDFIPRAWHRLILRLLAIKVHVVGKPSTSRPLLIVSNHVSWTDVMVIGSVADVHFIARGDMAHWPVMGTIGRLRRTVFIERGSRRRSAEQTAEIAELLKRGDVLVLFAEGTTGDGSTVLPFKTALFAALYDEDDSQPFATVQPVSVSYLRSYGIPLGRLERTRYAWIGDQTLAPHLLMLLKGGAVDVEITFGEPILPGEAGDRKALAARTETMVRSMAVASRSAQVRGHD
ncbi:1-acyl-sn-glycerol-3-phosphate acyltransferase [Chelativorans sp. ZYF759]|uniref:lysophospholipid acyltransferase family protein n=1 Tax=Chelativorans sp. ZYF759 TaxID=2692213 RepID=UPI00145F8A39|nr:1-acyl-sn-glycerol-3-phosphate acyltransferase [Chelativorans sp. ZYF759]NMG40417.1 1-acyl-sn-glycerol-3-phosphate acyltransferase [Chelativorans sp. ZYF759]